MILNCPKCNTRFMVDDNAIGEGREVKCGACAHQWFVDPNPLGDDFADFMPMDPPKTSDEEAEDLVATFEEAYEGKKRPKKEKVEEEIPEADLADTDIEEEVFEDGGEADEEPVEEDGGMIPEFEEVADAPIPNFAVPSVSEDISVPPFYKAALGISATLMVLAAVLSFNIGIPGLAGLVGLQDTSGMILADVNVREVPARERARFEVEGKIVNTSEEAREIPTLHVALLNKEGEIMVSREFTSDKMLEPGEDTPFTASRLDTAFKDQLSHILIELGSGAQLMLRN